MLRVKTPRPNLYDYVKVFAIIIMIIDHVGFFLYPDILELRHIGRVAFPLFLFLVGYNGSYRFSWILLWISLGLQAVMYLGSLAHMGTSVGHILWAIIIVRCICLGLQYLQQKQKKRHLTLVLCLLLILASYPLYQRSNTIIDYGTLSIIFGVLGYITSQFAHTDHKQDYSILARIMIVTICLVHIKSMSYFAQTTQHVYAIAAALIVTMAILLTLSRGNPSLSRKHQRDRLLLFCSRYALYIYVIHLIVLMGISYIM